MEQKKVLIGLMVGCFFLVGMSSAMAALWDPHCQMAIKDLQRLQHQVALKKQEVDAARVVEAIPADFVQSEFQNFLPSNNGVSQAQNELKTLFQDMEYTLSKFSQSCLKHNRISR